MLILGINAYHPDSAACIIKDGRLLAAVEEERFRRIKHWSGLPLKAISYCLQEAGADFADLDYIAFNRNPRANILKKLFFVLTQGPSPQLLRSRFSNLSRLKGLERDLVREFSCSRKKTRARMVCIEHHRAHLASAFFVSGFDKAAVLSLDGFGDFSSCMAARGEGNKLKYLFEINYPHSLGIFYTAFTQFLGFDKFGDEYKVMGLSAYGKPRFAERMKKVITFNERGYVLNLNYFDLCGSAGVMSWENTEPVLTALYSGLLVKEFGPPRKPNEDLTEFHCDIASSLQSVYEEGLFRIVNRLQKMTSARVLCFSGGCAMNSLANGRIFERTSFRDIFIQPASSDAGGSLGAAYYLYNNILGRKRDFVMTHAYWGPHSSDAEIQAAIAEAGLNSQACSVQKFDDNDALCKATAECISQGKIVGWFQGRMEWGPRALGNRSILADPRRKEMQEILNERIKRREWFRPFAPAILLEKVGDYFECSYPDPFMLKVYPIKKEMRDKIPAVTHQDGTGRLQTVAKEENYLYWSLIHEFEKITGIPVLLNTSFNENEPIVCDTHQAIECFLRTRMDLLVLGNWLIRRPEVSR